MQHMERVLPSVTFQRIDAGIDENILDKDKEKTILDASGKTEASHLADFVRNRLGDEKIAVEAKSLASEALPGFVVIEEKQRRMRDYLMQLDPKDAANKMQAMGGHTFVVNTNNPLMAAIQKLDHIDPDLSKDLIKETYELALLSQREMNPSALNEFVARSNRVLEKLANLVGKQANVSGIK
jgi:molecular chaperone HtpG